MDDLKNLWPKVLERLVIALSPTSYQLWVEKLEPLEFTANNELVLVTESKTAKNQIKRADISEKNKILGVTQGEGVIERAIKNAVKMVFGQNATIKLLDKEEKEEYISEREQLKQQTESEEESEFNEKYTFDNFVVGKSNQFVYAGALAVAQNPGKKFNPLFIYGGVGLGKTHLLHAIGNYIKENSPSTKIMYVTCDKFMNDYIESMMSSKREECKVEMRKKYRGVDVLMIDDIQYLSGRAGTQEEFFNTFNELYQNQKQIIISSDRPPNEIATLAERLSSRFASGLMQDIQSPDFETRVAILRKKAEQERYAIDDEAISFIADKCNSNIREMEGLLSKVHFLASLQNIKTAGLIEAMEAFNQNLMTKKDMLTLDDVVTGVCVYYNVRKEDVIGKKKSKEVVIPRMVAQYLMTEILSAPLITIAKFFNRDHSTVGYARDKISEQMRTDNSLAIAIGEIKNNLTHGNI